jgi:hypothetical protein
MNGLLASKIKQYAIVQPLEVLVFTTIGDLLAEFEKTLILKTESIEESFADDPLFARRVT